MARTVSILAMDAVYLTLLMVGMVRMVGMVGIVAMAGMVGTVGMVGMVGIVVISGNLLLFKHILHFIDSIIPIHIIIIYEEFHCDMETCRQQFITHLNCINNTIS